MNRFILKGLVLNPTPLVFCGTPGWIRTSDFQLRRLTLYPLSYGRLFDFVISDAAAKVKLHSSDSAVLPMAG